MVPAQLGLPNGLRVDAQTAAGPLFNGMLGVQVVGNRYFVSGRRDAAANPHKLFEFDAVGALVANYNQPAATATSAWGVRDMAYDGQYIWGGLEGNVLHAFDPVTNAYVANTITVGAGPTLIRALAYNPNGNGGQGSFWTGNFNANIYEFSRTGTILRTIPNPAAGPFGAVYGAAYDPGSDTVWWFAQGGGANMPPTTPAGGVVWVEMFASGPNVGQPTGQMHLGDVTVVGTAPNTGGGIAGGADWHLKNGTTPTLVALTQAVSDTFYEQAGRYSQVGCAPAQMRTARGAPCSGATGNPNFTIQMTGLPASISLGQMVLGTPGGIPPLPPLLPCGLALTPIAFLPAVPVAAGTLNMPLPIPPGLPIHATIEVGVLLIDLGPPLTIRTVKITIVFTS
jgi:hypothetical protein